MWDDDDAPPTEPQGALVPPVRVPPTAVGLSVPPPPPPPPPIRWRRVQRATFFGSPVLSELLDRVDDVADRIASLIGLR